MGTRLRLCIGSMIGRQIKRDALRAFDVCVCVFVYVEVCVLCAYVKATLEALR